MYGYGDHSAPVSAGPKERMEQFRGRQLAKERLTEGYISPRQSPKRTGQKIDDPTSPARHGQLGNSKYGGAETRLRTASPHGHADQRSSGGNRSSRSRAFRERVRTGPAFRTRADTGKLPKSGPAPVKAARGTARHSGRLAVRKSAQTAQQRMVRQAAAKTGKAAKLTAAMVKRAAVAAVKAVASLLGAIAGLAGGAVVLVALAIVIVIAAVINSPFGLFFAREQSSPDAVSTAQAVAHVNMELNTQLEALQSGGYDAITIQGQPPDWAEVLAVFAAKTAGAEDGVDVVTLDPNRRALLSAVFWDMCAVSSEVETIDHPASGNTAAWTETVLTITISARTADDMRTDYSFTSYQNSALNELLADRAALSALAGDLSISDVNAKTLLQALPADLDPERKAVVEAACSLVGKVNYFWGGKSLVLGWNSRWGQLRKVTAAGSSTTGTYRPYGLDCSGMVDWVFYNVTGGEYIIGHGGGAHMQHTYCTDITWDEAQPGDLVFYPEDEHVGIVGGQDESGNLLIIHCASGANNVVITGASGFTSIARPMYYSG